MVSTNEGNVHVSVKDLSHSQSHLIKKEWLWGRECDKTGSPFPTSLTSTGDGRGVMKHKL